MTNALPDDQLPPLPPSDPSDDHLTPPPLSSVKAPSAPGSTSSFASKPLTPPPTIPLNAATTTTAPNTLAQPNLTAPITPTLDPLPPVGTDTPNLLPTESPTTTTSPAYAFQPAPVVAPFSAQPMPQEEKQKLEAQAEQLIKDTGGKIPPPKKPTGKTMQMVLGALALVLVGAGVFFGQRLISMEGIGDVRQQASLDDIPKPAGGCPRDYPFEKDGWCFKIDPNIALRETIECPPEYGVNPQLEAERGGCLRFTNPHTNVSVICIPTPGGGIYCGGLRDGTTCAPVLSGGGDWCTVIGGGTASAPVSCASLGLSRCSCNNGTWVIGVGSCSEICGSTGNTCDEPCKPPEITTTPPPATHLECRNNTCAYVAGAGANTCDTDSDCSTSTPPPTTPPPTVTPTPNPTLACVDLTSVPANPKLGDSVRYTCSGTTSVGSIHHYGFEYKVGSGAFTTLAASAVGSAQSAPLVISEPGTYTVRCRACKSTDDTNCTAWQTL